MLAEIGQLPRRGLEYPQILKRQLVAAQVEVERLRAAGELVNRTDLTSNGGALTIFAPAEHEP